MNKPYLNHPPEVKKKPSRPRPQPVRIFALGGLGEIGKNMYGIEYRNEIILIDAGLKFPDADMSGVDYIIPDIRYLLQQPGKVKALIVTHGHEDHIGAIPYLLKQMSVPIYGGPLTIGLIKAKLEEHRLPQTAELHTITGDETLSFLRLKVRFFRTMHSIPDAFGVIVDTPYGPVVHTGDFKFDFTPEGAPAELHKIMAIGKEGALALLSDSTNSEREGQTPSERTVGRSILEAFRQCDGRILFATFASNVHRLQQVVQAAIETNRKIMVVGRSMEKVFTIGQELGYIRVPDGMLIDARKLNTLPANRVLIVCTGSQGETNAALTRIASGSHRTLQIHPGDTVIFSSSPIPGNVQNVSRSINMLMRAGAHVVYGTLFDIHTSGHGSREDLKLMLRAVRPQYFIPIHGEYRMLLNHKRLAEQTGVPADRIYIMDIGETLSISKRSARKGANVPSGSVFISQGEMRRNELDLISERHHLSQDGVIIAALTVRKKTRQLVFGPDIVSRGFVYMKDSKPLMKQAEKALKTALNGKARQAAYNRDKWHETTVQVLTELFEQELGRAPVILPAILEI